LKLKPKEKKPLERIYFEFFNELTIPFEKAVNGLKKLSSAATISGSCAQVFQSDSNTLFPLAGCEKLTSFHSGMFYSETTTWLSNKINLHLFFSIFFTQDRPG